MKVDAGEAQKSVQALIDHIVVHVGQTLSPALSKGLTKSAETSMRKLCTSAIELFKMLHRSKSLFRVEFTSATSAHEAGYFRPETMQAVNSADEDAALEGRPIQISVFPGVYKFGDEMGNNVSAPRISELDKIGANYTAFQHDEMAVICKARVIPREKPASVYSKAVLRQ